MTKVEILEGSPVYLEGLRSVLQSTGWAVSAKDSVEGGLTWRADVFLVDVSLVDDEHLSAFVTDAARVAPVLLLTDSCDDQIAATYSAAGASGMVDRRAATGVIVTAIRSVLEGGEFWDESHFADEIAPEWLTEPRTLSPRELQVLRRIARGLTHTQIATRLGISRHTVDTYVKRIRAKLNLGNKAELTRAAVLSAANYAHITPPDQETVG